MIISGNITRSRGNNILIIIVIIISSLHTVTQYENSITSCAKWYTSSCQ